MWITPVTDRALTDVNYITSLRDKIVTTGWSSLTASEQFFWWFGNELGLLSSTDEIICTSASEPIIVGEGVIRGSLNISDLNRVEGNCQYLVEYLASQGYYIQITTDTEWWMQDIPYKTEQIDRIRNNIIKIVTEYLGTGLTPTITISNYLGYTEVNNWEISLDTLLDYITSMIQSYYQCGTLVCGEV